MSTTWTELAIAQNGLRAVEHGSGRGRRITQRVARKALRASGIDPIVQGYCHPLSAEGLKLATAAALSPKAMVTKFERMAAKRKAERAALKAIDFSWK